MPRMMSNLDKAAARAERTLVAMAEERDSE